MKLLAREYQNVEIGGGHLRFLYEWLTFTH